MLNSSSIAKEKREDIWNKKKRENERGEKNGGRERERENRTGFWSFSYGCLLSRGTFF